MVNFRVVVLGFEGRFSNSLAQCWQSQMHVSSPCTACFLVLKLWCEAFTQFKFILREGFYPCHNLTLLRQLGRETGNEEAS